MLGMLKVAHAKGRHNVQVLLPESNSILHLTQIALHFAENRYMFSTFALCSTAQSPATMQIMKRRLQLGASDVSRVVSTSCAPVQRSEYWPMVVWVHLFGMLQGDGWEGPLFGRASNDKHRSAQRFYLAHSESQKCGVRPCRAVTHLC